MLTVASFDDAGGSWLWRCEKLEVRRGRCQRGGAGCKEINNIKQTLTVASSDDVGGSWLWRRGKLAVTRQEASVRDGGLVAKK